MSTMSIKQFLSEQPKNECKKEMVTATVIKEDGYKDGWFEKAVKFLISILLITLGLELVLNLLLPAFFEIFRNLFIGIKGI